MFLHLTLQEYLSALYWSQQTRQKLKDDFLKKGNILRYIDNCAGFAFQNNGKDIKCESVHWPILLFLAGLTKLSHPFSFKLIPNKEKLHENYIVALCQFGFEAQSLQILSTMLSSRKVEMNDFDDFDSLAMFLIGYCIANSDNTTVWAFTSRCTSRFSIISDGLYYSLNKNTDWNARHNQPSVHLTISVKCLQSVPRIHLLTSVTSEFSLYYYTILDTRLDSGEAFSLFQSFSHLFPRLVVLKLPALSFILTDSPQLPQSLVSIRGMTLPNYNVLLDNLHEYPALEDLEIDNNQDWKLLVLLDYTCVHN